MYNTREVLESIKSSARTHRNPKTRVVKEERQLPYNRRFAQGDVQIQRLENCPVDESQLVETTERQLAPGTSPGSRHILRADPNIRIFRIKDAGPLDGPVFYAPEGFYLSHPTHGDADVRLPGWYPVTFQADLNQEELTRLRD